MAVETPWTQRARQIEISIVNHTHNKVLEIEQLGTSAQDDAVYFFAGEQVIGATTTQSAAGEDTEAHPGDVLLTAVASPDSHRWSPHWQGVCGAMTITVRDRKTSEPFYMNIVFEHAVTPRIRGGAWQTSLAGYCPCGNQQTSLKKFNVKLTESAHKDGTSACEALFWSPQTICRNANDLISGPIRIGDETFKVKAIARPSASGIKMADGVHYVYVIEQVDNATHEKAIQARLRENIQAKASKH